MTNLFKQVFHLDTRILIRDDIVDAIALLLGELPRRARPW
jgi:hypothetical protein